MTDLTTNDLKSILARLRTSKVQSDRFAEIFRPPTLDPKHCPACGQDHETAPNCQRTVPAR